MGVLGSIADWWDAQRQETEDLLDDFVVDHPNWFAIGLATGAHTAMELGSSVVDVLRLGQGVSQGTFGGFVEDGFRLLGVAGPAGRIVRYIGQMRRVRNFRFAIDCGGDVCTWLAAENALTLTGTRLRGTRLYATTEDLLAEYGYVADLHPLKSMPPVWPAHLARGLEEIGARVRTLGPARTMDDVIAAAKKNDGAVLFSVQWTLPNGIPVGHTLVAARDALGRVRIADRSGRWVKEVAELERAGYPNITQAIVSTGSDASMVVVEHARLLPKGWGAVSLSLPISRLVVVNGDETSADEVKREFERYKRTRSSADQQGGKPCRMEEDADITLYGTMPLPRSGSNKKLYPFGKPTDDGSIRWNIKPKPKPVK